MVNIGALSGVEPVKNSTIAPGTATNKETADEVPIERCGSSPQALSTGTVRVPPPMPSITDKNEMQKAITR